MSELRAVTKVVATRYASSGRAGKKQILDELCATKQAGEKVKDASRRTDLCTEWAHPANGCALLAPRDRCRSQPWHLRATPLG